MTKITTFDNIIEGDELKEKLINSFQEIYDILAFHSGPFATNALVGSKYRQVNDVDEFTKDGINILANVSADEDASARLASRMARFVGFAVDSRSHDGTTTSMLACCALAILALQAVDNSYLSRERIVHVKQITGILEDCLTHLTDLKITDEDLFKRCQDFDIDTTIEDVRAAMSYHMALISSKGDKDLATKIATVIRRSPKKIYNMYRDIPLAVETEEKYILKRQAHDLLIGATLGNMDAFNYKNNTQFYTENAVIFATDNEISFSSMEGMFLKAFISNEVRLKADLSIFGMDKGWSDYHEGVKQLIILAPRIGDTKLMEEIELFNNENPNNKVVYLNLQIEPRLRTVFDKTLHYMSGVPIFTDVMMENASKSLIGFEGTPAKVHLLGSFFAIHNLFERGEGQFHPFYQDEEAFPKYTEFRHEQEEIIEFAQKQVANPLFDRHEYAHLTSLYRSLTCQEIYDIEVGGTRHEQKANSTVYEDAIGAALSAVSEGVVLAGYAHLAKHFSGHFHHLSENISDIFVQVVADSLRIPIARPSVQTSPLNSFARLMTPDTDSIGVNPSDILAPLGPDKWSYMIAYKECYGYHTSWKDYVAFKTLDKETMEAFLACDTPVLLQAFGGYHEQFKRFIDLMPKLANTSMLIDMRRKQDHGGS